MALAFRTAPPQRRNAVNVKTTIRVVARTLAKVGDRQAHDCSHGI